MNRKGFFKTIFGGILAATAAPTLLKSEEKSQPIQIKLLPITLFQH